MAERTEREVLNHLIETCRDAELGFRTAALHVSDPELRTLLNEIATERARCAAELLPHAHRLGGASEHDGTSMGALHRRWVDIKTALRRDHDHAVLVEMVRGDKAAMHTYREAVEGLLPPDTRDLVEQQYNSLRDEYERLSEVDHNRVMH